jgi:mitogen-activated protein kinase kinase kinase 7
LHHPNVVQFYGVVYAPPPESVPEWMVLERATGGSLELYLRSRHDLPVGGVTLRELVDILADVAAALVYLHAMKPRAIVHRDLKPANVLVFARPRSRPVFKISDVGTAKCVDALGRLMSSIGSPAYRAPEVCRHCSMALLLLVLLPYGCC